MQLHLTPAWFSFFLSPDLFSERQVWQWKCWYRFRQRKQRQGESRGVWDWQREGLPERRGGCDNVTLPTMELTSTSPLLSRFSLPITYRVASPAVPLLLLPSVPILNHWRVLLAR